jgi:voltage-dependent calcium channel
VSLSFLFPFAIYGLNLFNGRLLKCNNTSISGALDACIGEYGSSPSGWNVLAPQAVANPYFNFDNFGDALFILFQIVSQEGWIDVQWSTMSITGLGQQPAPYASPANALFFVAFNILGAVFVLTLFVSVFMRNYTEQTGVAFLTVEQRSWLELKKLLKQISPSKRSAHSDSEHLKIRCYQIAKKKHGRWHQFITTLLVLHLVLLMLGFYPQVGWWEQTRRALFLLFTLFYLANLFIRIVGLGWRRFRRSWWDLFSLVVIPGALTTTILAFIFGTEVFEEVNSLFLDAVVFLLIPRNKQLDQLFKTAAASLTAIGNLIATWLVLFLVFGIAMTQIFGLTKFGQNETNNLNFRDIPRALIFLFRTSCGEGWNQLMEDYATMRPPYCTMTDEFFSTDCGSESWARSLFIAWNILSMYLFVSLFVSLIYESFSYVYQRKSGLHTVDRDEIRRFKEAWAAVDGDGTGYISTEDFPRLLGVSEGIRKSDFVF